MPIVSGSWPKAYLTGGVIVAGFVFCLAADLPGHLSWDSIVQLLEGRTGRYMGWHPPFMSWLLGLFDAVLPGTALFVAFDATLFFGSLYSLVWLRPKVSWAAAAVALLIVVSPIALLYQGIVWKDVLFADTTVAGFVCLTWASARWQRAGLRFALVAVSLVLLGLATMSRQNGALALLCAIAALGWIASRHEAPRLRMLVTYAASAAAFAFVFITAANIALGWRIVAPSGPAKQLRLLEIYDIIGFVAADKQLPLNELHAYAPDLEQAVRTDGVRLYNPERNDPLAASQSLQTALVEAPWDAIRGQWLDLILHHPLLYAQVRLEVFRWIFLTPDINACLPYLVGITGPQAQMEQLDMEEREDGRDDRLRDYTQWFLQTPVLSHLFYAFLALGTATLLFIRRRDADIPIAMLQAGTLLFSLSFLIIGIACDYRYLYAMDIASLVGVFYIALDWSGFDEIRRLRVRRA
ncbi:MAG TPA: hypothetical protein VGG10_21865 [Rhizomicrobium sp.]|jgi:hypothetical protein